MSNRPTADFKAILSDSGVPTTQDEFEAQLKSEAVTAGSAISNDSEMSPFWRWVRSAVVTPCLWLINTLLAGHILPNMFVGTAERWSLELKAWEHDITPKDAVKTQGYITLTKAYAEEAATILAGSVIQTLPLDGVTYNVTVLDENIIDVGQLTGKVLVEASEAGAAYNLPAGYFNILPEELPGIVSAVNEPEWITRSGANAETDEELALRIQNAFTSSGEWHIDDVYRSMIASVAGIRSDNIYFQNTGHITPGTAIAYILMEVGLTPQSLIDTLNEYIMTDGHHGHGDVLTCMAIPSVGYELHADVVLTSNLTTEQTNSTLSEVEQRIRAAFREVESYAKMTRTNPNSRFSVSLLGSEIHQNMPLVQSIKISVNNEVQEDIISALEQPRLSSLVINEVKK